MKLTKKQTVDLTTIEFFIPPQIRHWKVTNKDRKAYRDWSDKGIRINKETLGIKALKSGKTYREVMIEMYKEDLFDGTLWHFEIEENFPKDIAEYILKATGYWSRLKNFKQDTLQSE